MSRPPSDLTKAAPTRGWDHPAPTQAPGSTRETREGEERAQGLRDEGGREGRPKGREGRREGLTLHREMKAVAMH